MSGTNALLVNCVEPYGRTKSVDAYCEHFPAAPVESTSLPLSADLIYPGIIVMLSNSDSVQKLVIGTRVSNLLVTSSVTVAREPVIQVSPNTKGFQPSAKTGIYLDVESVDATKKLAQQGDQCF